MSENIQKEVLERIESIIFELNNSLPKEIRITSIAKIPFKILSWRETLLYRTVELSNCALNLYNNEKYISACILIRAQMETTGYIYWSHRKIQQCIDNQTIESIDDFLMKGLFGGKDKTKIIDSHNALTAINHINKDHPDFRDNYDMLSEYAHPNHYGTFGSFTELDIDNLRVKLGSYINDLPWGHVLFAFFESLVIFKDYYNRMAENIKPFIELSESQLNKTAEK